jgi:hypothetical protein
MKYIHNTTSTNQETIEAMRFLRWLDHGFT